MSRLVRRQKGSQVRPRHRGLNWKFWRKLIWKLFASTGDRKVDGRLIRPTFGLIKDSSTHFAGNISTKSFLMSARDNWIELLHRNLLRAVTNERLSAIVRESIVDRSRMSWNWVLWEMEFDEQVFNYLRTKSLPSDQVMHSETLTRSCLLLRCFGVRRSTERRSEWIKNCFSRNSFTLRVRSTNDLRFRAQESSDFCCHRCRSCM